jgi:integrase
MIKSIGPERWKVRRTNKDRFGKPTRLTRIVKGSKARAKRVENELMELLVDRRNGFEYSGTTYGQFLEKEFFPYVDTHSPGEHDNITCNMRKWCTSIWELNLDAINPKDIRSILDTMGEDCAVGTVKKMRSNISRSFNLAMEGGLKNNPVSNVKVDQKNCKEFEPGVLNREEIKILLTQAKILKPDWYPIWAVSLFTGLRVGELIALQRQDADLDQQMISVNKSWSKKVGVKSTKSGRWRKVPIADNLMELMRTLMIGPKQESLIKMNYILKKGDQSRVMKQFCQGIGISVIRHHDLRATFITQLFAAGASIAEVQSIVGHVDLKTTQRYLRLSGVDVAGVTNKLDFVLPQERVNNVVNMF